MFISADKFCDAYVEIKQRCLSGGKVVIMAAMDTDSACAATMLTKLFEKDTVMYQLFPVRNYSDVMAVRQVMQEQADVFKTAVLVNVGASYDVQALLNPLDDDDMEHNPELLIYMIESHRPINLYNVYSDVQVFDDGETSQHMPTRDEIYLSDEDDDDDDNEEANQDLDSDGGTPEKRAKRNVVERRERTSSYYETSCHAAPACVLVWHLITSMQQDANPLLWMAMVGLMDAFLEDKLSSAEYYRHYQELERDASRLNGHMTDSDTAHRGVALSAVGADFRFPVYRHWNLYEAIQNSRYVAARLEVWQSSGTQQVHNMLARAGLSIKNCQQNFTAWNDETQRKRIMDKLEDECREHGLKHPTFPSFQYRFEFRKPVTASDMAMACTALFVHPRAKQSTWQERFHKVTSLLEMNSDELFQEGVELAAELERVLIKQLQNSISTGAGSVAKSFRLHTIEDDPDQEYFGSFTMLQRLARLLVDYRRFNRRKRLAASPQVIASRLGDRLLVCGIWAEKTRKEGDVISNRFSSMFEVALEKLPEDQYSINEFDKSQIDLHPNYLQQFTLELLKVFRRQQALKEQQEALDRAEQIA
eukprot:TRINITY_DN12574_c4_g8_i2.p1 TRINITY_DN12574_c4_g8~~TRINITY_DN12574_c4_g8_i2.p1  ORF type:complete len:590 (+),score=172.21 TRINITY_DN12574_c4_g8_i2:233-2002(+)